jgi:hypothetical protein
MIARRQIGGFLSLLMMGGTCKCVLDAFRMVFLCLYCEMRRIGIYPIESSVNRYEKGI